MSGIENFSYDELNRVTKITQTGEGVIDKRVDFSYDAASQMTGISRYSDIEGTELIADSSYSYDNFGRLIDLTHSQDTTTFANYNWVYDQDNRITGFTSKHGTANYSYDDLDQLLNAEYDYQDDENYSYDDNGNRVNDGYIIGDNNQVLSDGTYNYEYDREGNIISKTDILTGQVTQYQWDHRNRLTSATVNDSNNNLVKSANYTYDALNRRIGKEVDSDGDGNIDETSRFVLDGDHIALTFDGEGNQRERFLHGAGIDQVIAQESDGEVYWALSDNKGTVETVLNNEGDIVNEIIYDAFGNIESETDSNIEFRFGYTGRELDEETGLQYYRARYYDGELGRFISQDPIGFLGGDVNLYRYVNNSPLNYIDPSGLRPLTDEEHNIIRAINRLRNVTANGVPENSSISLSQSQLESNINFSRSLDIFKESLIIEIHSVELGEPDPPNLAAVLYGLNIWANQPERYSYTAPLGNFGLNIRELEENSLKCNRFVGDSYALGAGVGYGLNGGEGAYPTRFATIFPFDIDRDNREIGQRPPYPISAEQLSSGGYVPNLSLTNEPQIGDIISFESGHTGLYLNDEIYISARAGAAPTNNFIGDAQLQVQNGVQISIIPDQNENPKNYRRFDPTYHDSYEEFHYYHYDSK